MSTPDSSGPLPSQSRQDRENASAGGCERTALYRLYDADDRLLYIGISIHPNRRFIEHKYDGRTWWPLVSRHTVEWLDSQHAAGQAEREAIRTESPAFNVLHSLTKQRTTDRQRRGERYGDPTLRTILETIGNEPFAAVDLHRIGGRSKASTDKHLVALRSRGEIVPVGRRVNEGYVAKRHVLYAVASSPLVTGGARIHQGPEEMEGSERPKNSSQHLQAAVAAFGRAEFSAREFSALVGLSRSAASANIAALVASGLLRITGKRRVSRTGHPSRFYAIAEHYLDKKTGRAF